MVPSLHMLSCESSVSVKENPYRKKGVNVQARKHTKQVSTQARQAREDTSTRAHKIREDGSRLSTRFGRLLQCKYPEGMLKNVQHVQNKTFKYPVVNYMFKVNNRNTRSSCEICSKLTIKTPERWHWLFIIKFEQAS